jgi:hypothetical protein
MTRINLARLLAATCLSLVAVAAWQLMPGTTQPPAIAELMSAPTSVMTEDLYPAMQSRADKLPPNPASTEPSVDQQSSGLTNGVVPDHTFNRIKNGYLAAKFTTNSDQTFESVFFQDDGIGKSYLVDYYARLPGEAGRRQKGFVLYCADGVSLCSEEWNRLDGSAQRIGHSLGGGYYVASTLFPDGQTAETEKLWAPDMFSTGHVPKLERELRWYPPVAGHALAYTDVLNEDGTREQTSFDKSGWTVLQVHIPLRPPVGTTVKMFFPATHEVRLESTTDLWTTDAKEYRLDGTLWRELTLRAASFDVRYYDATGRVPLFEQTWLKRLNGVTARPSDVTASGGDYILTGVVELDAAGSTRKIESPLSHRLSIELPAELPVPPGDQRTGGH